MFAGINPDILSPPKNRARDLDQYSVATRLSWAAERETTREEGRSYSLLLFFRVNMPVIYGEGGKAVFFRLQTEIFKSSGDHSIFAWRAVSRFGFLSRWKDVSF